MIKRILQCAFLAFCIACAPTTKITASWKSSTQPRTSYKTIFVAALMSNSVVKSALENDMSAALEKQGIKTIKSINEFPPHFGKDSVSRENLMKAVRKGGEGAILTISILKKETESRYVSGGYYPVGRFGYYNNFWGYYNYWYPNTYSPSYYTDEDVYYLEANLYNSSTELLLWSAQTRTYSYDGITSFSREFADIIVAGMKRDGVL